MPASSSELEELEEDADEDEEELDDDDDPDLARLPARPNSPPTSPRRAMGTSSFLGAAVKFCPSLPRVEVASFASLLFWAAFSRALRLLAATAPSSSDDDDDELDPAEESDRLGRLDDGRWRRLLLRRLSEPDEDGDDDEEPLRLRCCLRCR